MRWMLLVLLLLMMDGCGGSPLEGGWTASWVSLSLDCSGALCSGTANAPATEDQPACSAVATCTEARDQGCNLQLVWSYPCDGTQRWSCRLEDDTLDCAPGPEFTRSRT